MYIGGLPVPLQSQIVAAAGAGGGGGGGGTRTETYNTLPYAESDFGNVSYAFGTSLPQINDGLDNTGPIANGGYLGVVLTFAAPVYLNRLSIRPGQFNGSFNQPEFLSIYRGVTTANLLYTGASSPNAYNLELFANANFDTASAVYRIDFTSSGTYTAVLTLAALGVVA